MDIDKIPVLVVGDAPNMIGGLARIARDLTALLFQDSASLGIEVAQCGIRYSGKPFPWRVFPLHDEESWGARDFAQIWDWWAAGRKGVVLSVWDPSRCFELASVFTKTLGGEKVKNPPALWGYFAVDAETEKGGFGGPAAEAVQRYDRVLGYGGWGLEVLRKVVQKEKDSKWLPHGIEGEKWKNNGWEGRQEGMRLLGCVAANQPRKDLGLLFSSAKMLRQHSEWRSLKLWLHTDFLVKNWSISELAELYDWNSTDLIVTQELDDVSLASMYGACDVTLAPGLGEGFGYPIVESLAAGTPVIHGDFAGGAEWVPRKDWLVSPELLRVEGLYALQRPVYNAEIVAQKLAKAGDEKLREFAKTQAFCQGAVKNLDWQSLWPRWKSWVKAGLREVRKEEKR